MPHAVGDRKVCSACRENLPLTAFSRNRSQPDGLANQCNTCLNVHRKRWADQHPEYQQAWRNGLSVGQYNALVEAQDGKCAVCKRPQKQAFKRLHVDHDHVTGAYRGLLCHPCNGALGQINDDPAILRALAEYIEGHRAAAVELPVREAPISRRGEAHHQARLTAEDIQKIRALVMAGVRQVDVAPQFGVTPAHVSLVVHRRTWKHLPEITAEEAAAARQRWDAEHTRE